MKRIMPVATAAVALLAACEVATTPTGSLTVLGSASAPPATAPAAAPARQLGATPAGWETGAPASLTIRMYALWISPNADCSAPVLVQTYGDNGQDKDFMENPVLFTGTPAAGTYPCVMFRMSDVLRMKPATSFGACVAGTEYSGDIYRDGESDWKDVHLNPIIGRGTDEAPVDDRVTIFFSRNPEAVFARGISPNQFVLLESDLIVPGQSTLNLDAREAVVSDGVGCGLEPPRVSFR